MHKDAIFFLVKSQRKVVDQNKEIWVRCQWTKSQDMAENLRFSCLRKPQFWCNTLSLARRRGAQRKTWLVGNHVGIQTIIATPALSKWASLSVVVLFRWGVKSAAELSWVFNLHRVLKLLLWRQCDVMQKVDRLLARLCHLKDRSNLGVGRAFYFKLKEGFSRSEVATS